MPELPVCLFLEDLLAQSSENQGIAKKLRIITAINLPSLPKVFVNNAWRE
jgi:hypothetical protein